LLVANPEHRVANKERKSKAWVVLEDVLMQGAKACPYLPSPDVLESFESKEPQNTEAQ
jgi:hypothetical protein